MADISFPTNLLPGYQSPQQMGLMNAQAGQAQAQAGLIGAQTAGQGIQNQSSALSLGLLQGYLQNYSSGSVPAPPAQSAGTETVGSTNVSPDAISQEVNQSFQPLPTARPPAVLQQMQAAALAGKPELAQMIGQQYDAQVQSANQQKQLAANRVYQGAQAVAEAPPGTAWDVLNRLHPDLAAGLKQQYPDATPEQLDADTRALSEHYGLAVHQFTGRDSEFQNGMMVDKKDGKPVLGSEQVLTGLDAKGKGEAFKDAKELVTVHQSDGSDVQIPRYQQAGFQNAEQYVIAADRNARSAANSPQSPATPAPPPPAAPVRTAPSAPAAAAPKPSAAPAPSAAVTTDPVLKKALADTDYKLQAPPVVSGRTPTPAQLDQQKETVAARTALLKDSSDLTQTAAQSLQYSQAAKAILDSGGRVPGGLSAPVQARISQAMQSLGITSGDYATRYQELSKYLGNLAVQNFKNNFGSKPANAEFQIQMHELNPSAAMTPDAVRELLETNIRNAQYAVDSGRRAGAYVNSGMDPQRFTEWQQKYYPRAQEVNQPARPGQQTSGPVKINGADDYGRLAPGTHYIDPNGVARVKGGG